MRGRHGTDGNNEETGLAYSTDGDAGEVPTAMARLLLIDFPIFLGLLPGQFNVVRNFLN